MQQEIIGFTNNRFSLISILDRTMWIDALNRITG